MEKIKFKVKANVLARNEMHFEVQLKNRMQIQNSKKNYDRNRSKREDRRLIKEYCY